MRRDGGRRAAGYLGVVVGGVLALAALPAGAQERLLGSRVLGGAGYGESITFGDGGIPQFAFAGLDTVRVTRATQQLIPVTAMTPLGGGWRLDVTAFHARGTVTYREAGGTSSGRERTGVLEGISDVRLRASGRFLRDAITLTAGVNLPAGRTALDAAEFATLRVLVAPGLGMASTPVGAGPSGTLGVVLGRTAGAWALAAGTSYEYRGTFAPVAALIAGAPSSDFRPGGVVRASLGADRLVGAHRLSLAMSADIFAEDRLRQGALELESGAVTQTEARVRLGPVFSGDAQLQLATRRVRELTLYTSYLWRAAYARDGVTADGSSAQYLAGGARTALPLAMRSDLIVVTEGRWHSGLGTNEGLPTSGVRSASVTIGLNARRSRVTIQPYVRAQGGVLRQRGAARVTDAHPFHGIAGGLVLLTHF